MTRPNYSRPKRQCPINPIISAKKYLDAALTFPGAPNGYYAICKILLLFDKAAGLRKEVQEAAQLEDIDVTVLIPPKHANEVVENMRRGLRQMELAEFHFWQAIELMGLGEKP